MSIFVQYAPYKLIEGSWDETKDGFADRCIDLLTEFAPGFKGSVIAKDPISPLDLEREFSLTGGNIFHGAMVPHQLYFQRPLGGWARYRTPIKGLYLCGAGAHPVDDDRQDKEGAILPHRRAVPMTPAAPQDAVRAVS